MGPIGAVRERVIIAPRDAYPFVVRVSERGRKRRRRLDLEFCMRGLR